MSSDCLLAERERDVLEMLVRGVTCRRELVERLVGSENTIAVHQGFAERPEPDTS